MSSYVIMEAHRARPGERGEIVADRFILVAFLLPVIWLLWHRLWIEAFMALAAAVAIALLGRYSGLGDAAPYLSFIVGLYVGLEGSALRLAALERRGYRQSAVIEAGSRADAELRYVTARPAAEPSRVLRPAAAPPASLESGMPMVGLTDYPGGRQ